MKNKIIVVILLTLLDFSLSLKYSRPFASRSTTNNKPAWSSRPFSRSPGSTFTNPNYHSQRFVPNSRTQSSLRGPISYPQFWSPPMPTGPMSYPRTFSSIYPIGHPQPYKNPDEKKKQIPENINDSNNNWVQFNYAIFMNGNQPCEQHCRYFSPCRNFCGMEGEIFTMLFNVLFSLYGYCERFPTIFWISSYYMCVIFHDESWKLNKKWNLLSIEISFQYSKILKMVDF